MYSVELIDTEGKTSLLSVKGRTEWKAKRIAINHANDIRTVISKMQGKGGPFTNVAIVNVVDDLGNIY